MGENDGAGTDCNNHQLRAYAGRRNQRRHYPTCGDSCNGCGTQRDTQDRSDRPCHQQRRNVRAVHHGGDVFVHAAINQNLFEGTATTDDQQHHRDDFD